ncbi:MAG: AMP-binding protein, partial [Clostridia bacterium]|nr:AMP-binding protein [Clostridia bacterium]
MNKDMLHEPRKFENVRALVEWGAEYYGNDTIYSFRPNPRADIVKKSFIEFRDDVRALASELLAMGCAGRHCAIIGKLSYEWAATYYAMLSIGGVLIPLDRDWQAEDLAATVERAEAKFLFCDVELKEKAAVIENQVSFATPTVYLGGNEGDVSLASLIEKGRAKFAADPDAYFNAPIDPHVMALLVFTSGTTGKGKGVMLSQNAILTDLCAVIPYMDFGKKTVGVLPPHHTFGSSVMLIGHMMIGSEIYISGGLRYVAKELKEQEPEHLVIVPLYLETFYRRIMANLKEKKKEKLVARMIKVSNGMLKVGIDVRAKLFGEIRAAFGGKVKMIISGGAPINPEILNFFEAIGISTLNGYGITECAPIIAVNRSKNPVRGSVGHVLDIDTVKIDHPNEDGEGEIWVTGPNVMLGYFKDEAATKDAIDEEGYFKTGDYGKLDKNNVLYITGRKKNLIILSNGKNVYPEEIENELVATPGVIDIIVYEGQSKRGMEHNAIVAEVYPDNEYIQKNNITDIKAHLQKYVDDYNRTAVPYKKIGVLKVRAKEFPKNTLRKIQRFQLDTTID